MYSLSPVERLMNVFRLWQMLLVIFAVLQRPPELKSLSRFSIALTPIIGVQPRKDYFS